MNEYVLEEMLLRIKETAIKQQKTYFVLSKETGISISTLSKILSGVIKDPSISSITKIAKTLGVTLDYLVFGENNGSKAPSPYDKLNEAGRAKADEYITDLSFNPKYTAQSGDIASDVLSELKDIADLSRTPTSKK